MDAVYAVILGIVQGITEFLPISSSGHLVLMPIFTGEADQGVAFDLAVHIGTLLAVVLYFRSDVGALLKDGTASIIQRRHVGQSRLAWSVAMGTIPAGLAGLALLDLIDTHLRSAEVIMFTTLVFGLLLGFADFTAKQTRTIQDIKAKDVLIIGLFQALALVPGTSRSGSTITAGLLLGLTREAASRFSFLLAIPITALASAVKILEVANDEKAVIDWMAFALGGLTSFITAMLAIHFFLKWLNRFGMWPYVIYRIVLAFVIYLLILS
jgi:undecaprenyl-diphosphatase